MIEIIIQILIGLGVIFLFALILTVLGCVWIVSGLVLTDGLIDLAGKIREETENE